jgi:hypothetical protein
MSLNKSCIVLQTHIDNYDPAGNLTLEQRRFIVDLSIKQLRWYNPNDYIIVTGHGVVEPSEDAKSYCNHFMWESIAPQMDNGQVKGMPAQYYYVSKGIKYAKQKGFTRILKTRGDTLIGVPNILEYCEDVISKENTKMLLTQQTGWEKFKMGDCFIFGETDLMDKIWDMDNKVMDLDGLVNTGIHFLEYFTNDITIQNYVKHLKQYCSFRDLINIKFACTRWNYHTLDKIGWDIVVNQIKSKEFNFNHYHWGKANNFHQFDLNGNMIHSHLPFYYFEKSYYNL